MVCPNCGKEFKSGKVCPECKIDSVLFSGTVKISDVLYNRGLARAKAGDLSGAIECLIKSVQVNRNNVQARNLLGLAQYEIGRVGDALKEWVISQSLMRERNQASVYLEEAHKSGRVLENANDAVRMYNQALEYIRLKSDDMAIIQLKKAVECNPKFIDALNLLTLCYLIQRDRDRAGQLAERVLSLDVNNTIALNYFAELYPGRAKPDPRSRNKILSSAPQAYTNASPNTTTTYQRMSLQDKKNNFHIAEILSFIIGAVCMFGALYVLVIPSIIERKDAEIAQYRVQAETAQADYDTEAEAHTVEVDGLQLRIENLEAEADNWEQEYDLLQRTNLVLDAYGLLVEEKYQEAINTAAGINVDGLPSDIAEKAADITAMAYPILAEQYYNSGFEAYNSGDIETALSDLEQAHRYAPADAAYGINLLYYYGLVLYEQGDARAEQILTAYLEVSTNNTRMAEVNNILDTLRSDE